MKRNFYYLFPLAITFYLLVASPAKAQSPLLNFGFEAWTSDTEVHPFGWFDNNTYGPDSAIRVQQVTGMVGNAIHLATMGTFSIPGTVYNTHSLISSGGGGTPYSGAGIPTNLAGYYRYHVVAGDSAIIIVLLKKAGAILSIDTFYMTGDLPAFTPFSLPLTTITMVPDSVVFLAESGTFRIPLGALPGSTLDLDEVHFTNGSTDYPLLNGSFDTWSTVTVTTPDDWTPSGNVTRSTDKHSGVYAAQLETMDNGSGVEAGILYGTTINLSAAPYVDTLTGYYKYSGTGGDKGAISITFWDHAVTGDSYSAGILLNPASTYTFFKAALVNPIHATDFNFFISSSYPSVVNGSLLLIDDLNVKSGNPVGVPKGSGAMNKLSFYPVPCRDVVHIAGPVNLDNASYVLYNMLGQVAGNGTIANNSVDLGNVPSGSYMCVLRNGADVSYGQLEVLR